MEIETPDDLCLSLKMQKPDAEIQHGQLLLHLAMRIGE